MSPRSQDTVDPTAEYRVELSALEDTVRVQALPQAAQAQPAVPGEDPYNRTIPPVLEADSQPRRSLDDMRRLSEAIKAQRAQK